MEHQWYVKCGFGQGETEYGQRKVNSLRQSDAYMRQ